MQTKGRKMKSFLIAMIALILVGCGSQSRLDISELDKCISKSTDVDSLVITISDKRLNSQATMLNWKEEETQYGAWVYVKKGIKKSKRKKRLSNWSNIAQQNKSRFLLGRLAICWLWKALMKLIIEAHFQIK